MTRTPRGWTITEEAFLVLMKRLGPEPETAANRFQALHAKLSVYFTYERCSHPEHLADETLDRVAKKLSEGQEVTDVTAFARGAAKLVLLEARKREQLERNAIHEQQRLSPDPAPRHALRCLDDCLASLPETDRSLIGRYYSAEPGRATAERRKLAEDLGITIENLRTRALRIRKALELCVTRCRENGTPGVMNEDSSPFHIEER